MKRLSAFVGLAAMMLASSAAYAEPGPSLTSAEDNVAFATAAICAPYVLDGKEEADLPLKRPLVASDGWTEPSFTQAGAKQSAVRVGFAGHVHVAVGVRGGSRTCELVAQADDAQALRQAALKVLNARAEHFGPTKSRYLPGARFETEDMLCTAIDSAQPLAFVLLSAAHAGGGRPGMILLTLRNGGPRGESCDHEGVRLNYRTLAP